MKNILLTLVFVLPCLFGMAQTAIEADKECSSVSPPVVVSQPAVSDFKLNIIPDYAANSLVAKYSLPRQEDAKLSLYTERGKLIRGSIVKNAKPGEHSFDFDLNEIAAGVYLLWLTAHNDNLVLKFTVSR